MKICIPQNYFAGIWALMLDDSDKTDLLIKPAPLLSQEISNSEDIEDLYLLPSMSLVKNKDLYISQKCGVAFDGLLSNSYLYLRPDIHSFESILLRGDVSVNEILLTKILFLEKYDSEVEIKLDTSPAPDFKNSDYLITGNGNLDADFINSGISYADQVAAFLNLPYVEYVLASRSEQSLMKFNEKYKAMDARLEDNIDDLLSKLNLDSVITDFIKMNLNSLYFEITENEIEGLNELLKLPFYHGMTKEISELKLI